MYVCVCNGITESQVQDALEGGVTSLDGLRARLGVASGCGGCASIVLSLIDRHAAPPRALPEAFTLPVSLLAPAGAT